MNNTVLSEIDLHLSGLHLISLTDEVREESGDSLFETLTHWILSQGSNLVCVSKEDGNGVASVASVSEDREEGTEFVFINSHNLYDVTSRMIEDANDLFHYTEVILVDTIQEMNPDVHGGNQGNVITSINCLKTLARSGLCVIAISKTDVGSNDKAIVSDVDTGILSDVSNDDILRVDTVSLLYWEHTQIQSMWIKELLKREYDNE